SFIPVFSYSDSENLLLSTHVDRLASVTGQTNKIDLVSKVDFILHGVVTFPYTVYKNIFQVAPATEHYIKQNTSTWISRTYWQPRERNVYLAIDQAARDTRQGLQNYVERITNGMSQIAQFMSG